MKKKPGLLLIILPIMIVAIAILVLVFLDVISTKVIDHVKYVFGVVFYIYVFASVILVILEKKNPQRMIAWLLVLILFPLFGLFAYLLFGRSFRKKYRVKHKKIPVYPNWLKEQVSKEGQASNEVLPDLSSSLITLLQNNSGANLLYKNKVKVMSDGALTFSVMLDSLRRAEKVINFMFFIIKDDELGRQFQQILIEKAKSGVEVNFLYDAVGSWKLSRAYRQELEDAGVRVKPFLPVLTPFASRDFNYRNHRKIVTIDGKVGFVGGLNIGNEYVGKKEQFGYWRDTHLMIEGEAVYALTHIFLDDWVFSEGEFVDLEDHYPPLEVDNDLKMQIVSSGPDSDHHVIMQGYFKMITQAKKTICITTPYLVPEDALLTAIKTAALSGVEVKIIIPDIADHFMVYWANQSYIQDLLEHQVKIYKYKGGFVHAKSMFVDGICASVGTANLDIRSMELNFEVNAFIYDEKVVRDLYNDFEEDLIRSELIDLEKFKNRKLYRKVLEVFGRLVSPLQ